MRRLMVVAASAGALVAALAVGPFGATAAAPYLYGCTSMTLPNAGGTISWTVNIYNGSATTSILIIKFLDASGRIFPGPFNQSLPATQTFILTVTQPSGNPGAVSIPTSLRVVSNVPVSIAVNANPAAAGWQPIACMPLQP